MSVSNRERFEHNLVVAKQGDASAMLEVSASYMLGTGVLVNLKESFGWCKEAAEQGNTTAQLFLGYMFLYGLGTPPDKLRADLWFNRASSDIESNTQIQSALIKYGFIKEVSGNNSGLLYKRQANGVDRAAWLSLESDPVTGRREFLSVPPYIESVQEAVAWKNSRRL